MLTRRRLAATAATLPLLGASNRTRDTDDLTLVLMGDLHSGYRWSSRLLRAVSDAVAESTGPVLIVVNGDVFERNNVVGLRSEGAVDLALLHRFAGLAPTLVTIGNHDSDLFDPRRFADDVAETGAILLSDITDPRRNATYGAASHTVTARNGARVVFAAVGTPDMSLYPARWRPCYAVPDPEDYAAGRLPALFAAADLSVALVHAGFAADRRILPHLPSPALLHGAHDHLRFTQHLGDRWHLQSGAWSNAFQVATIRFGGAAPVIRVRDVVLDERAPFDPALQAIVDVQCARWLATEDRAVLGRLGQALTLEQAVRRLADRLRAAAGTDLALLSHTTFGDGLPAGPVSHFDRDAFLRFDGGIAVGEIAQEHLPALRARLDQFDGRTPYARRTGDFLHASELAELPSDRPVRVAVNAYAVSTPANRMALFGFDATGFAAAPAVPHLGAMTDGMIAAG